ncbi:hypothetical protein JCM10207_000512 [Rhodosporidiobolus poonsookiae]
MTTSIALLGAGGFATKAHLPAIAGTSSFKLVAVYSRSLSSVNTFIEATKQYSSTAHELDVYSEDPSTEGLDALLARSDISTLVLALPITTQPAIIEKALRAGKSVISEKPVAPSLDEAKRLISLYEREFKPRGVTWLIAEQYAHTQAYTKAKDLIRDGKIGELRTFSAEVFFQPSVQAASSGWRSAPDYQGGFILDGGVHFAAGLRHILPYPLTSVFAHASQIQPHLPPCDTLQGLVRCTSPNASSAPPISGSFTFSFGTEAPSTDRLYTFRGSRGVLTIDWASPRTHTIRLTQVPATATSPTTSPVLAARDPRPQPLEEPHELTIELPTRGVEDEFEAFGEAFQQGTGSEAMREVERRSGPRAALRDLAFIEGGLRSSAEGREFELRELVGEELWEL